MHTTISTSALALLLAATVSAPAMAADLGQPRAERPPVDFAPPIGDYRTPLQRWNGFYLGVTGGYGFGSGRATGGVGSLPLDLDGGLASVFAGYNWQQGAIVLGLEADIGTGGLSASIPTVAGRLDADLNALGSFRGRVGYLMTPALMLYATGGLAWASMDFNLTGGQARSETFFGYQIGAGGELAISDQIGLRLEYVYTDLGSERVIHGGQQSVYDPDFHTVRAGLSFKF